MTHKNVESVELRLRLHHDTPQAILVSDDGDLLRAFWLAKSMIQIQETTNKYELIVTLPRWKAEAEGLV